MNKIILYLSIVMVFTVAYANETRMEAKVYFTDPEELFTRMGDLFGDLDICTVQPSTDQEYYLLINTTQDQLAQIQDLGFNTEITFPDIAEQFYLMAGSRDPQIQRTFGYFYTYWETVDTLQYLASLYPSITRYYSAGNSYQGLSIIAFKISDNPTVDEAEPSVCFNGATHAREPMGNYLCMDFVKYLLANYGSDSFVTWLVNNREIYFLPVLNPDGYRYNSDSGGSTANWRKNRRIVQSPYIGIDLNRNYGYKWGYDNIGSSGSPSSEGYRGPSRFSEIETQVARDFYLPKKIRTQIDYHSYGSYNLCVWGYSGTAEPIPDSAMVWEILDSMRVKNGYPANRTGPCYRVLYAANGTSTEWETKDTLHLGVPKFSTFALSIETNQTNFWDGVSNWTTIQNNINQCRPVNIYFTKIAGVFFDNLQTIVADTALGNQTGELDQNETSHVWFRIRNRAVHPLDSAYNISAQLVALDTQITVIDNFALFPRIYRNSIGNNSSDRFTVYCSPNAVPGTQKAMRLTLTFKDDTCTISQNLYFNFTIGNNPVAIHEVIADKKTQTHISTSGNPALRSVNFIFNSIPSASARLNIYNSAGVLVNSFTEIRKEIVTWHGNNLTGNALPTGIYFYIFNDNGITEKGKLLLLR